MNLKEIILYDEPTVPEIQIIKLKEFLHETFQIQTSIEGNFFQIPNPDISKEIAGARIFDLKKKFQRNNPTIDQISIEKNNTDMSNKDNDILYDGFELQKIISKYLLKDDEKLHIIFTNKLACTFDDDDFRYHARSWIGSNPIIISTSGMIEGPAKPKKFYLELMTGFDKEFKTKFKGQYLEYHDARLYEIAKGYLLQSIIYFITGEAFCMDKECRLYNSHWQKDLLFTQCENKKLCNKHQSVLKELKCG